MNEVHPARIASEAEIQAAMKQLNDDQRRRLRQHLGTPPRFENVPDSFWQDVEDEQAALLLILISSMSDRSARYMRDRFKPTGLYVPDTKIETRVAEYAVERAAEVSQGVTETVKNRLQNYFEREQKARLTDEDLQTVLGDAKAKEVAITEATAATANGESIFRDDARENGKEVKVIWRVDPRSNACKICRRLNGRPEEYWVRLFPLGPPAHPSCACDLETIIDGISAGTFLPNIGINPVHKSILTYYWLTI